MIKIDFFQMVKFLLEGYNTRATHWPENQYLSHDEGDNGHPHFNIHFEGGKVEEWSHKHSTLDDKWELCKEN